MTLCRNRIQGLTSALRLTAGEESAPHTADAGRDLRSRSAQFVNAPLKPWDCSIIPRRRLCETGDKFMGELTGHLSAQIWYSTESNAGRAPGRSGRLRLAEPEP